MDGRRSPVTILLVEDNPDHALLSRHALRADGVDVVWAKDGHEAIEILHGEKGHAVAPAPALILLDVYMPCVGGHEVLAHVKSDARLRMIPVVMLTTSGESVDIRKSYLAGANSFVTKPAVFADFAQTVRTIRDYWIGVNRLPDAVPGAAVTK